MSIPIFIVTKPGHVCLSFQRNIFPKETKYKSRKRKNMFTELKARDCIHITLKLTYQLRKFDIEWLL